MKRILLILTLGLMMAVSAKAQIFDLEDESNLRDPITPVWPQNPDEYETNDFYVPAGSGILMLAALGGAYLLGKRDNGRKE